MPAMHNLPLINLSATFKNLALLPSIEETNFPYSLTSEYLFNKASLGTLTFVNLILALSTPLRPNF